jgi:hypothetical protein
MVALAAGLALTAGRLAYTTPSEARAEQFAAHNTTAYTLPPGELERAIALNRTRMTLEVAGDVWMLAELLLILAVGAAARMRDVAVGVAKSRWAQGFSFVFLLLLLTHLLNLPLGIYGHRVALSYGLSVQGWGSWLADKVKLFALEWGIGGLLAMLMFWVIRKSPTRWWFWFWIPVVVCVIAGLGYDDSPVNS